MHLTHGTICSRCGLEHDPEFDSSLPDYVGADMCLKNMAKRLREVEDRAGAALSSAIQANSHWIKY